MIKYFAGSFIQLSVVIELQIRVKLRDIVSCGGGDGGRCIKDDINGAGVKASRLSKDRERERGEEREWRGERFSAVTTRTGGEEYISVARARVYFAVVRRSLGKSP